jgi:hypothetical protein
VLVTLYIEHLHRDITDKWNLKFKLLASRIPGQHCNFLLIKTICKEKINYIDKLLHKDKNI